MPYPAPHHPPRLIEQLRDDDTPGAPPWPWQAEPSGQARRSEQQQLADLGEHHGRH
jgi:hypothetical protein